MDWLLAQMTLPISESAFWLLVAAHGISFGGWLIRVHMKLNELMVWKQRMEAEEATFKELDKRLTAVEIHQGHILEMLKKIDRKLEDKE